jgi:hypothetical protein
MGNFTFWREWPPLHRQLFYWFGGIFFLALLAAVVAYIAGVDFFVQWMTQAQTEPIPLGLHSVVTGLFEITLPIDSYIVWESYYAGPIEISSPIMYAFSLLTLGLMAASMAVVSALSRFWYYAGVLLFAAVVVSLKLELLMVFGSPHRTGTILALVLFLPLSYYFQAFAPAASFHKRLIAFLGAAIILAVSLHFFAEVPHPLLAFGTYGIFAVVCISLIFILSVSHESLAALMRVLTGGSEASNKSGARHFFIIAIVYLANVTLLYLYETKVIDWDFVYINPYLILVANALLGIWGYRFREPQFAHIFPYRPLGALAYFILGSFCFSTIGYFFITGNDPVLLVFRYFIIFGQLGYGLIFLVYLISNFINPLLAGKPVHRALYNPQTMPYFTFRLAGLIAVLAFLFKSNMEVPIYHTISSYYNAIGDMYRLGEDPTLAKGYYERGKNYGARNHRSNYMLAQMAEEKNDKVSAAYLYSEAIAKRPTAQAYLNLSNLYAADDRLFEAMFTLQDGLQRFPDNPYLKANLGRLYSQTSMVDSTYLWWDMAYQSRSTRKVAGANMLALMAKNAFSFEADSLAKIYLVKGYESASINYLTLQTQQGKWDQGAWPIAPDSTLNVVSAAYLYNKGLNAALHKPDSQLVDGLYGYSVYPTNLFLKERLQYGAAIVAYKNHDVARAFSLMEYLSNGYSGKESHYMYLLGVWAMEQGDWPLATAHLERSMERSYATAELPLAISKTEEKKFAEALPLWKRLAERDTHPLAGDMVRLLSLPSRQLPSNASDPMRFGYVKYLLPPSDSLVALEVIPTIQDANLRAAALLEMSVKCLKIGDLEGSISWYNRLANLQIASKRLFDEINRHELVLLSESGNLRGLAQKINREEMDFPQERLLDKMYYTALLEQANGQNAKAEQLYRTIAEKNPYYEKAVLAAAQLVRGQDKANFEAYGYLQKGLSFRPTSVAILKAFIMECVYLEMDTYAAIAMDDLQGLVSKEEFAAFYFRYAQALQGRD